MLGLYVWGIGERIVELFPLSPYGWSRFPSPAKPSIGARAMAAYTVASLADEWQCSEGVIRKAISNGELGCFRLGTLIRIPVEEVRRFECQNIPSSDCEEDMPSFTPTRKRESGRDGNSTRQIVIPPKRRRGISGIELPAQRERLVG